MAYFSNLLKSFKRDGLDFDITLSVITGGEPGISLSRRAAMGARKKIFFWCIFCKFLSWAVQKNHCEAVLTGVPMTDGNEVRALFWLNVLAALLALAPVTAIVAIAWAIHSFM